MIMLGFEFFLVLGLLAGGGSVAVVVGVSERWKVTCDRDMWHMTPDTWHMTRDICFFSFLSVCFGIGATIRTDREVHCLRYAGFLLCLSIALTNFHHTQLTFPISLYTPHHDQCTPPTSMYTSHHAWGRHQKKKMRRSFGHCPSLLYNSQPYNKLIFTTLLSCIKWDKSQFSWFF